MCIIIVICICICIAGSGEAARLSVTARPVSWSPGRAHPTPPGSPAEQTLHFYRIHI